MHTYTTSIDADYTSKCIFIEGRHFSRGLLCDAGQLLLFLRVGCSKVSYTRHIVTQHWAQNLSSEAKNHSTNKTGREKKIKPLLLLSSHWKEMDFKSPLKGTYNKNIPNLHFTKSVLIHFPLLWAWFFCYGNWSTRIS